MLLIIISIVGFILLMFLGKENNVFQNLIAVLLFITLVISILIPICDYEEMNLVGTYELVPYSISVNHEPGKEMYIRLNSEDYYEIYYKIDIQVNDEKYKFMEIPKPKVDLEVIGYGETPIIKCYEAKPIKNIWFLAITARTEKKYTIYVPDTYGK